MIIKNAAVFGENGLFEVRDIFIGSDHKIVSSEEETSDKTVVDASGLKAIPGLLDIHSHGAAGHDFSDGDVDGLNKILRYQKSHGITSYCPTSMTLPKERLTKIFKTAGQAAKGTEYASVAGINMEGPFIDEAKKGAHKREYIIAPDSEFFSQCMEASENMIKLVTLAPNVEGADDFIREWKDKVVISVGHTSADYDTARKAMEAGAGHITHLYNAMPPFSHRAPGVIGAGIDTAGCMAEIICDGIHIHPSAIRAAFSLFGSERMILISDSMMAAGMENGTYELGSQEVTVKDRKATLADGTLAGSATNLFDCMKLAISFGIPESDAIFAATRNPAKSIGLYHKIGSITPGKEADILFVNSHYDILWQI